MEETQVQVRCKAIRFTKRPRGAFVPMEQFSVDEDVPMHDVDALRPGDLLLRVVWLSLEPAMRGWMNEKGSYAEPLRVGEIMRGSGVAEVVVSNCPKHVKGDLVMAPCGWRTWTVLPSRVCRLADRGRPTRSLSLLGWSGLAAYFGLLRIGIPKRGETVLVSAAAGATGTVAAQIAKHICGCRVVGVAGGPEKVATVLENGADACVDYRKEGGKHLMRDLVEACPRGVDVYFDNVGGDVLDGALRLINMHARVVICGAISRYNDEDVGPGPKFYMNLLVKRARMEGFVVLDYEDEFEMAMRDLETWAEEGKVNLKEDIIRGDLDTLPFALQKLFRGENRGKLIVQIADLSLKNKL